MPFEVIDHTADMGIRVWAPDLSSLFSEAARGMLAQISDGKGIEASGTINLAIKGADETDLLINLLREVLYLFTGEGLMVKNVAVESISETALTAQAHCEKYDPEKHAIRTEIKAVTYAGGDIRKISEGFETTIIVDI